MLCNLCYREFMPDFETLQMALIGYKAERRKIDEKISELEARLNGNRPASQDTAPKTGRRHMSRAAKARIAAAQRKRWARFRKQHTRASAPAKTAKKAAKKTVSPEVIQKRLAGLAKARAARAAKRTAAKATP
jgi:hypothetical protein